MYEKWHQAALAEPSDSHTDKAAQVAHTVYSTLYLTQGVLSLSSHTDIYKNIHIFLYYIYIHIIKVYMCLCLSIYVYTA
jgi:hypothetical protein